MLAIESDADHVTLRKFNLIHEFLNTTMETPMGRGLGLDVSDSFFLYNGSNMRYTIDINHTPLSSEMTFFKGISHQLYDGPILLYYMKVGWIDTIHSMGDFSRVGANGHSIWGFWRFTGTLNLIKRPDHPWIYDWQDFWNPYDLYRELAPGLLEQLIRTHGYTIIAQHLEGNPNSFVLPTSAIESLVRLAHLQDRGMILVARTSRLLLYNLVQQHLRYSTSYAHGVTFIVRNPLQTVITLRGNPLPVQLLKQTAHTVGIAWYPPNTANYAVNSIAALRRGVAFDAIPFSWY